MNGNLFLKGGVYLISPGRLQIVKRQTETVFLYLVLLQIAPHCYKDYIRRQTRVRGGLWWLSQALKKAGNAPAT